LAVFHSANLAGACRDPANGRSMTSSDSLMAVICAESLLARGELQAAEREAQALLRREPENADALYIAGAAASRAGKLEEAEQILRQALSIDPACAHFHHELGRVLKRRGDIKAAVDSFREALRLKAEAGDVLVDLGMAHLERGALQEAVNRLRQALRQDPQHLLSHIQLGDALRRLGRIREARVYLQQALGLWLVATLLRPWRALRAALAARADEPRSAAQFAELAREHLARGNKRLAARLADRALELSSECAVALSVRGRMLALEGRVDAGLEALRRAQALAPRNAAMALDLARALRSAGLRRESAAAYEQCLAIDPNHPQALAEAAAMLARDARSERADHLLDRLARARPRDADTYAAIGRCRLLCKDLSGAASALKQALAIDPSHPQALSCRAGLLLEQGRLGDADAASRRAVEAAPESGLAHFQRGLLHMAQAQWSDAAASFREAAALDAQEPINRVQLAMALRNDARASEAEKILRESVARWPGDPACWHELGNALHDLGETAEARDCFETALRLRPDHPDTLASLASIINTMGDLGAAETYARRALAVDPAHPRARTNLGLILLKRGGWAEGWDLYESRKQHPEHRAIFSRFPFPEWDGTSLAGKTLLVYPEQGLGDEIMFASCLPDVARSAGHLIVECDPRLALLIARSLPGSSVFPRPRTHSNEWVRSLSPQPDYQVAIGSLARYYRRTAQDFPRHPGYLQPAPGSVEAWRERLQDLGRGVRVGLSWRGGIPRTGRARRSFDLTSLAPLLYRPNCRFISLQYGNAREEIARMAEQTGIHVALWQEAIDDYDQTAALTCALDAVVTVCTSLVHLCGALGRPTFVLAPYSPEWRYGISGESMAWYPSVTIARQPRPGDWAGALAAGGEWLDVMVREASSRPVPAA